MTLGGCKAYGTNTISQLPRHLSFVRLGYHVMLNPTSPADPIGRRPRRKIPRNYSTDSSPRMHTNSPTKHAGDHRGALVSRSRYGSPGRGGRENVPLLDRRKFRPRRYRGETQAPGELVTPPCLREHHMQTRCTR